MIIEKVVLTEEEKNIAKSDIEIDVLKLQKQSKYIASFGEKFGYDSDFWKDRKQNEKMNDIPQEHQDSIEQSILEDVKEILSAATKEDIERIIKSMYEGYNEKYIYYADCYDCLMAVLFLQCSAYEFYGLPNSELIKLIKQKTSEWYEIPPNIADSKKVEELPNIQRVKKPESVFYPLFKPTYTLFNNFPIRQTKKIKAESESDRRKGKTANILLLLSFDELDGVKISRPLTIYDKNVWNACANLSKYGYETVTAQDVYKFMGYNNNLNQRDKKKILESIETIIRARVFISNKEEHALYKKYDEISLNTPLLAAEICKAKIGNTIVEEAIRIIEPPKLFAIAERRGQITAIPFKVLESPINKNDDVALITDYLITRISRMKNNKNMTRTILLDTLYEKCNITDSASDRVKKTRLPEKIDRLLDHYKSVGWIDGYKLTKNEIVIILKEN